MLVAIAVIIFFQINYGLATLLPGNINWLMSARHDWGTHYLGWAFYKNEPWHFPLGKVTGYNYPVGTNVGFTDSIPLLAIFFKLFAFLLPSDFQFFGIWQLVCHLLAAFFTIKILRQFKVNDLITGIAALFIATNPVLVYRGMHPALCAHWLILACIYVYYLDPRKVGTRKILLYQLVLLALSAMINPYLCWMVLGFTAATPIKLCFFDKELGWWKLVGYITVSLFSVVFLWYITGLVEFGSKEDLGVGGAYGLYALNLNSLFNPFFYSAFLPRLPWVSAHQYEGFMYLGLGMIALMTVFAGYKVFVLFNRKGAKTISPATPVKHRRDHLPLLVLAIVYAIIAITLVFTYNDKVLLRIPAPALFIKMEEIFRACSRFFWTPYYLLILFTIIGISRMRVRPLIITTIVALAFVLQVLDTSRLLGDRGLARGAYNPPLESDTWIRLMSQFDEVVCVPAFESPYTGKPNAYQDFCFLALKAGKPIDLAYVARADSRAIQRYTDSISEDLTNGRVSLRTLYINSGKTLETFSLPLQTGSLSLHSLNGCYFLLPAQRKSRLLDTLTARVDAQNRVKLDSGLLANGQKAQFLLPAKPPVLTKRSIRANLEKVILTPDHLFVHGWAVIDSTKDNSGDSVFLTLSKDGKTWWVPAGLEERADVVGVLPPGARIQHAGIRQIAFVDSLPKGQYALGVAIKTAKGEYAYQSTDHVMKVKTPEYAVPEKLVGQPASATIQFDLQLTPKPTEFAVAGWANLQGQGAEGCYIQLIMKSDDDSYVFNTEPVVRHDVTVYFKNKYQLDNAGYSVKIAKSSLPKKNYAFGFLITEARTKKQYMMMTDKRIDLR
jgi:hypothetical protein